LEGEGQEYAYAAGEETDHEGAEEEDTADEVIVEEGGEPAAGEQVVHLRRWRRREGGMEGGREGGTTG